MSLANENDINNLIIPDTIGIITALSREANDKDQNLKEFLSGINRVWNLVEGRTRGIPIDRIVNNKNRISNSKERLNIETDRKKDDKNFYDELVEQNQSQKKNVGT